MYCLLDLGSILSYVTLYVDVCFGFDPEVVSNPFFVSTPVGDLIIAKRVYRGCVYLLVASRP